MNRCLMLASALLIGWVAVAGAAVPAKPTDDLAAIRSSVDSYVSAFNHGDARAVAQHWSEQGEWVGPDGDRLRGVANIEKAMQALFAEQRGLRVAVLDPRIRLLTPDVALEEGTVRVLRPGAVPDDSAYVAIHVKRDGQWKLERVRETEIARPPVGFEPLKALEWLVGDWVDSSQESTIETSVTWSKNRTFLVYSFHVSAPGIEPLEGTQVIGWDPKAKVIRSWIFDSDGGFGEGVWTHDGANWLVKTTLLQPDESEASATNVYTPLDANTFQWKSFGRQVNGMFLANIEPVKVVRKGTAPAKEGTAEAKAPPAKDQKSTATTKEKEKKSKTKEPAVKKGAK